MPQFHNSCPQQQLQSNSGLNVTLHKSQVKETNNAFNRSSNKFVMMYVGSNELCFKGVQCSSYGHNCTKHNLMQIVSSDHEHAHIPRRPCSNTERHAIGKFEGTYCQDSLLTFALDIFQHLIILQIICDMWWIIIAVVKEELTKNLLLGDQYSSTLLVIPAFVLDKNISI